MKNKNHWYDGKLYDIYIAPNQDSLFKQISGLIKENSTLIDVGCATGRFSFFMSKKCKSVSGIDLSIRNIKKARQNLSKKTIENISFEHKSLHEQYNDNEHFDYATITFVIHEVNENERVGILNEITQIADIVIVADYIAPRPKGFSGFLSFFIEFLAGSEHFRNYKNFIKNGGISDIVKKTGLQLVETISTKQSHNQIFIIRK